MFLRRLLLPLIVIVLCSYAADWTLDANCRFAVTFDQKSGDMLDVCGTFNGDMDLSSPPPPLRTEGKYYGGLNFGVNNIYLPFGDVTFMDGEAAFTFSFWLAQSEDYTYLERDIIRKDGTMNIQDSAAQERVYIWTSDQPTGYNFIVASDDYPNDYWFSEDGNWHMYTIVYNGTTIKGYRDCTEINSDPLTGTVKVSSTQFTMGNKDPAEGGLFYFYTGNMDDVIYLDRAIDVTECNDLMNNGIDGSAGHYPRTFKGQSIKMQGVTINGG